MPSGGTLGDQLDAVNGQEIIMFNTKKLCRCELAVLGLSLILFGTPPLSISNVSAADDWPMWRYDAGRTAASPHSLPENLQLLWTWTLPEPKPAYPNEIQLGFDVSYEPVVANHTMFVPSMVTDSVTALDTGTGEERWRFFAEGPVRFAPVA